MYHCFFFLENKKSVSSLHQKVMAKKGTLTKNKKERPNNKKEASSQPLSSLPAKQGSYEEGDEDFDQLNSSQTSNTRYDKKKILFFYSIVV